MLFWEKKPVKEGKKGGKKEGCFKEHWKVVAWVVVMVAAITFIVVDAAVNWNAVATAFALSTCFGDQLITPFSREIVVSDAKKCWWQIIPDTLDFTRFKYVESIELGSSFYSDELNLNGLSKLKSIRIGDNNFKDGGGLNLNGLKKLESVVIGKNCFHDKGGDRHFNLKDCPKVRELKIGRGSFYKSTNCVIESVPSLEVIEMDGSSFKATYLTLSGLSELKSVTIGGGSFCHTDGGRFHLSNCPKLKTVKVNGFSDYEVCEIENVDALEVIEMSGFQYASLELKSILIHSE